MNKKQAERLINELHELNKTLKTIAGSHERVGDIGREIEIVSDLRDRLKDVDSCQAEV